MSAAGSKSRSAREWLAGGCVRPSRTEIGGGRCEVRELGPVLFEGLVSIVAYGAAVRRPGLQPGPTC